MSYLSFLGNLFEYRPEQNVETTTMDNVKTQGAVCVKKGEMSMEALCQAIAAYVRITVESAKKFQDRVESSIRLTPSDRETTLTQGFISKFVGKNQEERDVSRIKKENEPREKE